MKPINKNDINALMERFDNFMGGEVVSLDMITPTCFKITITAQDKNRGFDWVNMNFEASEILDAKLVDDNALKAIDMSEGVSIKFGDSIRIGFGSSEYLASPLHLECKTLKYEESPFSL